MEGGAFFRLTYSSNISLVVFRDLFANGQANACSLVFMLAMQALEYFEDTGAVLRRKADAVILHAEVILQAFALQVAV